MRTPAQLVDFMFHRAKSIIESGREAIPMLVLQQGKGLSFIGIPWRNPSEKEFAISAIRKLLAENQEVDTYAMVSEAWASRTETADRTAEFTVQPRDDPKREELVMVTGYSRGGESAFLIATIKTLPDKSRRVMLPEKKDYTLMVGQMVNFFAPEEVVN
jgi:hypothetical protein